MQNSAYYAAGQRYVAELLLRMCRTLVCFGIHAARNLAVEMIHCLSPLENPVVSQL